MFEGEVKPLSIISEPSKSEFQKISVKGKDMHPIYNFLTTKDLNGFKDNSVKWNFQKYLINSKGELEQVISPQTSPFDAQIIKWINN